MIGVCVPAHDEERRLATCLDALEAATRHAELGNETARVLVVLDDCRDDSARVCREHGAETLVIEARNVGIARHAGAMRLVADGARWLAFTDADSEVAPDWLARQVREEADAVCGPVEILGWQGLPDRVRRRFRSYRAARASEPRAHGANLGVDAAAYQAVGGFPPLATGEDRALVQRLLDAGFRVLESDRVRVLTSSRRAARAPSGLGARLKSLE